MQAKSSARSAVSTNMKDIERKHRNYMTRAKQCSQEEQLLVLHQYIT